MEDNISDIIQMLNLSKRKDILLIGKENLQVIQSLTVLKINENKFLLSFLKIDKTSTFIVTNEIEDLFPFVKNCINKNGNQLNIYLDIVLNKELSIEYIINKFTKLSIISDNVLFQYVYYPLLKCTIDYIMEGEFNLKDISELCTICANNNILRFFIHLNGLAHSAQDIVSYYIMDRKNLFKYLWGKMKIDTVIADFDGGSESFVISKSNTSPKNINPIDVGVNYFPIYYKYEEISNSLASKLALVECCIKFNLQFGYSQNFKI